MSVATDLPLYREATPPDSAPWVDADALARDLDELREAVREETKGRSVPHLRRMIWTGRLSAAVGLLLAPLVINPVSIVLLAFASFVRWAVVAHYLSHGAYDRLPATPDRLRSKNFAMGNRRLLDWMDWMPADAWAFEHNLLHHIYVGEVRDPDQPESNADWIRDATWVPVWARYVLVFFLAAIWKPIYYAPSTINALQNRRAGALDTAGNGVYSWAFWSPLRPRIWEVVARSWLPYIGWRFAVLPALAYPLFGWPGVTAALVNLLLAEVLTNVWSFWVIVSNHVGDDVYRFDRTEKGRGQFYLRSIVGSVNYRCGGNLNDLMHGWLNYQIEHHVYRDLTLLECQAIQPRFKAICEAHGVPYVQESVFVRSAKNLAVLTGVKTMPVWQGEPTV